MSSANQSNGLSAVIANGTSTVSPAATTTSPSAVADGPSPPSSTAESSAVLSVLTQEIEQSLSSLVDAFLSSYPQLQESPTLLVNATHAALAGLLQSRFDHSPAHAANASTNNGAASSTSSVPKKPVRTYIDGCFDIMHSGHYNAIRQAKALTDILVVGVHSDAEILKHKGPPVMNNEERLATVKACKWVDEVVFDTPYDPSLALLDRLQCDYCVHGDDMSTTADGRDAYEEVKQAGRMKIVKRTEGISTTDLVGRLLLMTKQHHINVLHSPASSPSFNAANAAAVCVAGGAHSPTNRTSSSAQTNAPSKIHIPPVFVLDSNLTQSHSPKTPVSPHHLTQTSSPILPTLNKPLSVRKLTAGTTNAEESQQFASRGISNFLPTTWRLAQFSNNRVPSPSDKVIYIDGGFDLFHVGHIETLRRAKALGTFLYVGIHDDNTINAHKGKNYPIMNLHERCMNVLSCMYVDEVVIGAPWICSKDLVLTLGIHAVVSGSNTKFNEQERSLVLQDTEHTLDPYAQVKAMGIYQTIDTSYLLDTEDVIQRIVDNRLKYEKRNEKRSVKEKNYLTQQKQYIQEI